MPETILLAHEDEVFRKGIHRCLTNFGHEVLAIADPADIPRYLDVRPAFDTVVASDHEVTRRGFQMLEQHHREGRGQKFILLSDEASKEDVESLGGTLLTKRNVIGLADVLNAVEPGTIP